MKILNHQGQGVLELVIACGIIVLALASIITLTLYNVIGQKASEEVLIGSQLAREGIEVIRNLRDTARLGGSVVISLAQHRAVAVFNPGANNWSLTYNDSYTIDSAVTQLYKKNNLYVHDAVGSEPTKFRRLITLDFICLDQSLKTVGTCPDEIIGHRVKSQVQWLGKKDQKHNYEITDYLYEWK